jgi:DNA (cytosine-5)-methyltransferase 1
MTRPSLLDVCCCEGGAGMGYNRAGFDVTGVDIEPQPRYPFPFLRADALDVLADLAYLAEFDLIHVSPPCQRYSAATADRERHPDLLPPVRQLLRASGRPWIIENVPGAPMRPDLKLCGCMFGLPDELRRERWFETSPMLFDLRQPCRHSKTSVSINRRGGRYNGPGEMHNRYISLAECKRLMGIDWMSQSGLGEAIPPAYTEYVGALMRAELAAAA